MNDFLILIAPFIIIVAAIACAFWAASKDGSVLNKNKVKPLGEMRIFPSSPVRFVQLSERFHELINF